jgi:hypothetical protein
VEFAFARHVGHFARVDTLFEIAHARGEDRPALSGVDWSRVDEERIMQTAAEGIDPEITPGLPVDVEVRAAAAVNWVAGNLSGALAKWQFQERAPLDLTQLNIVAEGLAETGNEEARAVIERLRAAQPIEADTILARLYAKQGKRAEAVDLLSRAFVAYRRDPWPAPPVLRRALDLAVALAEGEPTVAERLHEALREPFSVYSLESARLSTAVYVACQTGDATRCADAWHAMEPWAPWDNESLASRREIYRQVKDPRREAARREAEEYLSCGASRSWLRCL